MTDDKSLILVPAESGHYEIYREIFEDPLRNRSFAALFRSTKYTKIFHEFLIGKPTGRMFTIVLEGNAAGFAGMYDLDKGDRSAGLWCGIRKACEGRGAAVRGFTRLTEIAFREYQLNSLTTWTLEENHASIRMIEKTGFKRCGFLRESHCVDGQYLNRILFDMTRNDFEARA